MQENCRWSVAFRFVMSEALAWLGSVFALAVGAASLYRMRIHQRSEERERELSLRSSQLERDSFRSELLHQALDLKGQLIEAHSLAGHVDADPSAHIALVGRLEQAMVLVDRQIDDLIPQYHRDDGGNDLLVMLAARHAGVSALSAGDEQERNR
ncbi:hypothetical protein AOT96_33785 (plasmid) [Rhodococcus sp. 008]|nr:hypothetical protein AOT96_33785 [Rhodococcus sp. 008]